MWKKRKFDALKRFTADLNIVVQENIEAEKLVKDLEVANDRADKRATAAAAEAREARKQIDNLLVEKHLLEIKLAKVEEAFNGGTTAGR